VVAPASIEQIRRDTAPGAVAATLVDPSGHTVVLGVAPRPGIEQVAADAWQLLATRPPRQIFGRVSHGLPGLTLEPIAFFYDDPPRIVSLGDGAGPAVPGTGASRSSRDLLVGVRDWQVDVLQAGIAHVSGSLRAGGHALAVRAAEVGIEPVARALSVGIEGTEAWLQAWSVVTVAAELLSIQAFASRGG
jgi:hypothetical protein